MTSNICWLRRLLADISPRDQRIESAMFDFPHPFGPTIAVMPGSNSTRVLSANDLKPTISSRFNRITSISVPILFGLCKKSLLYMVGFEQGCPQVGLYSAG